MLRKPPFVFAAETVSKIALGPRKVKHFGRHPGKKGPSDEPPAHNPYFEKIDSTLLSNQASL